MTNVKHNWLRTAVGSIILFLLMFRTRQFSGNVWLLAARITLFLIFVTLIAVPRSWWNRLRIVYLTAIVSLLIILSLPLQNNLISIYMLIVLTIPAAYVFTYPAYLYYLGALVIEMFLLLSFFGHRDYLQSLSLIFLFIGLALSLRARINKQEALRLSQLHLQELEKAHKELQQAAIATMQHAVLDERARIAREIHDAVGHSLTSLIVQLQALRYMIEDDPSEAQKSVAAMLSVARQGLNDIRVSVHALAADRSALGITPLQALASKINATTHLTCVFVAGPQAEDIPPETTTVLFKVMQEAITNILRHSQATQVDIDISVLGRQCVMSIMDNGQFLEEDRLLEGYGIKSMRERVEEAAGTIEFKPGHPAGLLIKTTLPIRPMPRASRGE